MDERKYAVRKLAGLPASGLRILYAKWKANIIASSIVLAILIVGIIVIFAVLPTEDRDKAVKAIVGGLMHGGVLALITVGMVVVYKSTRIFNMAHGGMLLFLTFLTWWLLSEVETGTVKTVSIALVIPVFLIVTFFLFRIRSANLGTFVILGSMVALLVLLIFVGVWWDPLSALFLVTLAAITLGWALDLFLFRGMIGHGELSTFLITMVLGFSVLHYVTKLIFEGKDRVMPALFPEETISVIGSYNLPWSELGAFIASTVMFLVFVSYFRFTKSGLAMRCVSEDNVISQSLGIRVKRIYTIAWIIGCLSAMIGGVLLSSVIGSVYASRGGIDGLAIMKALPIVILGGLESIAGAYFAALMIGLAISLAGFYIDPHIRGFSDVAPWVLLMLVMLVRPQGLFGLKGIKRI